jgi:hypothetical protein
MIDEDIIKDIIKAMENGFEKDKEHFSVTRDVFTARLESFIIDTKKYLEAAIIGEIGNNTFDHNFVFKNIRQKGVYCNFDSMRRVHTPSACLPREAGSWVVDFQKKYVVLSDYGRGVKDSLIHIF